MDRLSLFYADEAVHLLGDGDGVAGDGTACVRAPQVTGDLLSLPPPTHNACLETTTTTCP